MKIKLNLIWPFFLVIFLFVHCQNAMDQDSQWAALEPVNFAEISLSDFANEQLDLVYYLAHFHKVANSVVMEGENKGFIDISVWRNPKDNKPYNARIMESILSLVYFYTKQAPWNPYYNSPKLKVRIEAALKFWSSIQNEDGKFSEYGPQKWNLAATAFATKFMGESLYLLHQGPAIDQEIFDLALAADKKAIMAVFTDQQLYEHAKTFSNQFTNVWAGALAYLEINPDAEVNPLFRFHLQNSQEDLQSPVGFFYEKDGPDWSYNLGTHENNLMMAWHYLQDTELASIIEQKLDYFYDWLSYNAVLEPGKDIFFLNKPVETRQNKFVVETTGGAISQGVPLGQIAELARPYLKTQAEVEEEFQNERARLQAEWPAVRKLEVGEFSAFSPYAFLHRRVEKWYPKASQKSSAIKKLPYIEKEQFIHQRMDNRNRLVYTYVKTPNYYIAFNSGVIVTDQQRYGIGMITIPGAGVFLQSQSHTDDAAWGTKGADMQQVYEAKDLDVEFLLDGSQIVPEVGLKEPEWGELEVNYSIADVGKKRITFHDDGIAISIQHKGAFHEIIPLVLEDNQSLDTDAEEIRFEKNGKQVVLSADNEVSISRQNQAYEVSGYQLVIIEVEARDNLTYHFGFPVD